MADKIRVESTELEACVAAYRKSLETLNDSVHTYEQALDALRNDWTGRAFVLMSGKVAQMVMQIKNSFERVNDAISELEETKNLFNENESKLASNFNNLDAGNKSPFAG